MSLLEWLAIGSMVLLFLSIGIVSILRKERWANYNDEDYYSD
jgi:hypothetical protein